MLIYLMYIFAGDCNYNLLYGTCHFIFYVVSIPRRYIGQCNGVVQFYNYIIISFGTNNFMSLQFAD